MTDDKMAELVELIDKALIFADWADGKAVSSEWLITHDDCFVPWRVSERQQVIDAFDDMKKTIDGPRLVTQKKLCVALLLLGKRLMPDPLMKAWVDRGFQMAQEGMRIEIADKRAVESFDISFDTPHGIDLLAYNADSEGKGAENE